MNNKLNIAVGYNGDVCNENGFDDILSNINTNILVFDFDKSIIETLIEQVNFISKSELQELYPIDNFDEAYWFVFDNEFIDIFSKEEWLEIYPNSKRFE
jgi:hypothetical protein